MAKNSGTINVVIDDTEATAPNGMSAIGDEPVAAERYPERKVPFMSKPRVFKDYLMSSEVFYVDHTMS